MQSSRGRGWPGDALPVVAASEYGLQVVPGRAVLVPYDPAWVTAFEVEGEVLRAALQPWLRGGVEHIGSTSIPGLAAKPIIDMLAGVADFRKASAAEGALHDLGYTRAEHRPHEALYFFRPHVPVERWWQRTHHLHLTETTSTLWRERLAFRDALRNNRDLLQQYQNLKVDLAADHVDGEHYTAGKHDFVRRVLASVGVPLVDWRAAPASREV